MYDRSGDSKEGGKEGWLCRVDLVIGRKEGREGVRKGGGKGEKVVGTVDLVIVRKEMEGSLG